MALSCDVLVLGLGAVGSATLLALARRGVHAVGIECHGRAHDRGSSHGRSRITRHAYFEHPDYVPLLRAATAGFQRLEASTGRSLLERVGVLLLGAPDSEVLSASAAAAERWGVEVERLSGAEVKARFPAFEPPPGAVGLLEPGAGFVRPEAAIDAALQRAEAQGADVLDHCRVLSWREEGQRVVVETTEGRWTAGSLALALGAWTPVLAPSLAPLLTVTRQVQLWVKPPVDPGPAPCWLADRPGLRHVYGIPADPLVGDGLFKLAEHGSRRVTTAAGLDRVVRDEECAAVRALAEDWAPGLAGPVARATVCMYTSTPDGHFIVDRVPGCRRTWAVAGLSGHGFKLAPALGEALADFSMGGKTGLPVGFLGLKRFGRG